MADGFAAKDAAGSTVQILTDQVTDGTLGTGQKQLVGIVDATIDSVNKLAVDASGRAKVDASGVAVPVTDNSGSLTVDDGGITLSVDDGGGSLTVDGTVGVSGSVNVADGGGSLSVDDGGGSLTVDGNVGVTGTVTVDSELTTADLDTGAGADNRAVVGLVRAESGGGVLVGSANPLPTSVSSSLPAGSNVIGHVVVDSAGSVSVTSIPARVRTTDAISTALQTDAIMNGLTALTPKFAPITASASGVTTVIAAVASHKLRILGVVVVASGAVTVNFQSHTTTATKTGSFSFAANGGATLPFSPVGWFETVSGEALDINLGGAVAVGGQIIYVEV